MARKIEECGVDNPVFVAPKGWVAGEEEISAVVEEWKQTGKAVKPMRIKAMFPEQFNVGIDSN